MHELNCEDENREIVLKNISTCLTTKGYSRSVVIDSQRGNYRIVPNSLIEFMIEMEFKTKEMINFLAKSNEEKLIIDEYLNYIEDMEFSFWCPKHIAYNFIDIPLQWDSPSIIQNAIVCVNQTTNVSLILAQLEELNCFHLQLRVSDCLNISDLDVLLRKFESSIITSIELQLDYFKAEKNQIAEIMSKHPRVHLILFFKAIEDAIIHVSDYQRVVFSSQDAVQINNNSKKSIEEFNPNLAFYMESLSHNVFFNRKLCIDTEGLIRNAIELPWNYGNIHDTTIREVVNQSALETNFFQEYLNGKIDFTTSKPSFSSLWHVSKQLIDVCKDCEFKNMCFDERCPAQRKDGSWYYNSECNYNPYICKWEGEVGYKTLKECGVVVDEKAYQRDDKALIDINNILWQE